MDSKQTEKFTKLIYGHLAHPNYLIESTTANVPANNEKYAVVYFSSSGLYLPATIEAFTDIIIKKNRFEWYNTRIPFAQKHIFVRDVTYRFYQHGISNENNSPDKVAQMLREETEGYKTITVGSSQGAYAANLFGTLINAEYIFAFSPTFSSYLPAGEFYNYDVGEPGGKYENIIPLIQNSSSEILYMLSKYSHPDKGQYDKVKSFDNVRFLTIKSKVHGVPVNKRVLSYLFASDLDKLKKIYSHDTDNPISEYALTKKYFGNFAYIKRLSDYVKKYPFFMFRKDFYSLISE